MVDNAVYIICQSGSEVSSEIRFKMAFGAEVMLFPSNFSEGEWFNKLIDTATDRPIRDTVCHLMKKLAAAATAGDFVTVKRLIRSGVANEYFERYNFIEVMGEETRIKSKLAALEALLESKLAIIPSQQFLHNNQYDKALFKITIVRGSPINTHLLINRSMVQGWDKSKAEMGRSPLHIFCLIPDVSPEAVKCVLKITPDDINSRTNMNFTPLMMAVVKNNFALVKFLVENGADLNHTVPLFYVLDDEEKVRYVYMKVFTVDEIVLPSSIPFKYGALAAAVVCEHKHIILYLLYNGADPNGDENCVILFRAVKRDAIRVVKILLQQGLNVNSRDMMGVTVLHRTVEIGLLQMASLLLKNGADVNATDNFGWTPLHVACLFSHSSTGAAKLLLDAGSNVNAKTPMDFTALTIAEAGHNINFLSYLNDNIDTLHLLSDVCLVEQCSSTDHANLMNLLIDRGAEIDEQDSILGWSALHWAAASGDWRVVVLLVSRGANTKIKSKMDHNPYETAIFFKRDSVKDYLSKFNVFG